MKLTNRMAKNSLGGLLVSLLILAFTCEAAAQAEWVELNTTGGPPSARRRHTAVYDPSANRMAVFGGATITGIVNDVWVLTNANGQGGTSAWTQLGPTGGPPNIRRDHTAVYDPSTNRMTVFGGNTSTTTTGRVNDVWVLANANGQGGTPAHGRSSARPGAHRVHEIVTPPSTTRPRTG